MYSNLFAFSAGGTTRFTGVVRSCGSVTALEDQCKTVSGVSIPEFNLTAATGTFCTCIGVFGDLCNGRPGSLPGSATERPGTGSVPGSAPPGSFPGSTTEGRPGSLPGSAPQSMVGRMAIRFTVISLLSLVAARFLSQ